MPNRFVWLLSVMTLAACQCGEVKGLNPDAVPDAGSEESFDEGVVLKDVVLQDGGSFSCAVAGSICGEDVPACCSGSCVGGNCAEPVFCAEAGVSCQDDIDCCGLNCLTGECSLESCRRIGEACDTPGDCCSNTCDAGLCAGVPPAPDGNSCTTLGEGCVDGSECCSTNCQDNRCIRASTCQVNGDVCVGNGDCCSNLCTATSTVAGRCDFETGGGGGGCLQSGNPCESGEGCCSRICLDIGSGVKVCQFASGCRLTGESCTEDNECCGGGVHPNGTVVCQGAPNGRCDNGKACNPTGNICGAAVLPGGGSVNASQNCCDGKQDVCKLDNAGIPRCFGGCAGDVCPAECPSGYDGRDANCCVAVGEVCEFSGQCCGLSPCVPGQDGVLRCSDAPACLPLGAICDVNAASGSGGACCSGGACEETTDPGVFACRFDSGTTGTGDPPTPTCSSNGQTCGAASECCSGVCDGTCRETSSCHPREASCTSDGDCCTGLSCPVSPGQTSGVCSSGGSSCAGAGQSCNISSCCEGLICRGSDGLSACDGTTACACNLSL